MNDPLLEFDDLTIKYDVQDGSLTAVSDVSLTIDSGEFYGLAGESGSGKSTLVKAVIGALDGNGYVDTGKIRYRGEEIQDYSEKELNDRIRWKEISWIPQASMNTLDPLLRVKKQALQIAKTHTNLSKDEALERFREMFEVVGLPKDRINDYPHQFSGGMQQRTVIALALFLNPSLIIADEPTTALDVIMQDQILKYLDDIKEDGDCAMILVTHDISVILETCDSIAIMHASQIAESGSTKAVYDNPSHPYTILFKNAFPDVRYPDRDLEIIQGHPPQLRGDVDFCSFSKRCPWAIEECVAAAPPTESVADGTDLEHRAACVRKDETRELYNRARETEL